MPVGFVVLGRNLEVILTGSFTLREAEAAIASGLVRSRAAPIRLLIEIQDPVFQPKQAEVGCVPDMPESLRSRIAAHCALVGPDNALFCRAADSFMRHIAPLGLEFGTFRDIDSAKAWLEQMEPDSRDPAAIE